MRRPIWVGNSTLLITSILTLVASLTTSAGEPNVSDPISPASERLRVIVETDAGERRSPLSNDSFGISAF